jgi:hypothetical protein
MSWFNTSTTLGRRKFFLPLGAKKHIKIQERAMTDNHEQA